MAVAQRIERVPTNSPQNDGDWEVHSFLDSIAFQTFSVKHSAYSSELLGRQSDRTIKVTA
jgi:hypothetical protein